MKKLAVCSLLPLAIVACAPQEPPAPTARQLSDFERVIAGRTPGRPQSCINSRLLGGNRSYGEGIIVFDGPTSRSVFVNRPPSGCPELRSGRALRTRSTSTQLCRNDIATVFDPVTGIEFGSCGLGDFVEYRR